MGFREDYDRLIELLATEERADDIVKAKDDFWKATGKVYGEEHSFEMRVRAFFDWYVFDRKVDGKTPLDDLITKDPGEADIYKDFLNSIHSIFMVKRIAPGGMRILDLFTKELYFLEGDSVGFYKNAVFEGRLFPYKGSYFLSPALCFHPKNSKGIIKFVLKSARKSDETDILPLIHTLSHMNLKWETYRNIKVRDIYRFEEYEKRRWWNWWL